MRAKVTVASRSCWMGGARVSTRRTVRVPWRGLKTAPHHQQLRDARRCDRGDSNSMTSGRIGLVPGHQVVHSSYGSIRRPGLDQTHHPLPARNERGEDAEERGNQQERASSPHLYPPSDGRGEIKELDAGLADAEHNTLDSPIGQSYQEAGLASADDNRRNQSSIPV